MSQEETENDMMADDTSTLQQSNDDMSTTENFQLDDLTQQQHAEGPIIERQNQQKLKRKNSERSEQVVSLEQIIKTKKVKKETLQEREAKVREVLEELLDSFGYTFVSLIGFGSFGSVIKVINKRRVNLEIPNEEFNTVLKVIQIKSIEGSSLPSMDKVINRDFINSFSNLGIYEMIILSDLYIAIEIEYCQRGSLKSLVTNPFIDSQGVYVDMMYDLCNDLIQLHQRSIIHRDIKPDNILIRDDVNLYGLSKERLLNLKLWKMKFNNINRRDTIIPVSIADFGLAEMKSDITGVAGSPKYLAPEIKENKFQNYSPKVDVFALGLTFKDLCEKCAYINPHFLNEMMSYDPENRPDLFKVKENIHNLVKTEKRVIEEKQLFDGKVVFSLADDGLFLISCEKVSLKSSLVSISQHDAGPIFILNTVDDSVEIIGDIPKEWKRNIHPVEDRHFYFSDFDRSHNSGLFRKPTSSICIYGDFLFVSGFYLYCQHLSSGQRLTFDEIMYPSFMCLGKNCLVALNNLGQYIVITISGKEISHKIYETCFKFKDIKYFQNSDSGLFTTIKIANGQMVEEIRPQFWIEEMKPHSQNMSFGKTVTTLTGNSLFEYTAYVPNPLKAIEEVRAILMNDEKFQEIRLDKNTGHSLIFKAYYSDGVNDCVKVYPIAIGLRLNHHEITRYRAKFFEDFFVVFSRFYECGSLKDKMNEINMSHLVFIYRQLTRTMFENGYNLNFENIMISKLTQDFIECEINPVFIKKHTDTQNCRQIVGKLLIQLVCHCYEIEYHDNLTIEEYERILVRCIPKNAKNAILKLIGKAVNDKKDDHVKVSAFELINANENNVQSLYQGDFTLEDIQSFSSEAVDDKFKFPDGAVIAIPNQPTGINVFIPKIDQEIIETIQNRDSNFRQEIPQFTQLTEFSNLPNLAMNPAGNILVTSGGDAYFQVFSKKQDSDGWQFVCADSWNFGLDNSKLVCVRFIGEELFFFGISSQTSSMPFEQITFEHKHLIWRRVKLFIPRN